MGCAEWQLLRHGVRCVRVDDIQDEDDTVEGKALRGKPASRLDGGVRFSESTDNAGVIRTTGLPLCRGELAFEQGHSKRGLDCIAPLHNNNATIGASQARRDIKHQRSDAERAYKEVIEGLAASPELSERNRGVIWRDGGNHWRAAAQAAGGGKQ